MKPLGVALVLAARLAYAADVAVPVHVVEDRFIIDARRRDGAIVTFFTDSGGGLCMVYADGAVTLSQKPSGTDGEKKMTTTPWSSFAAPSLPPASSPPLYIVPRDEHASATYGFLGQSFFAGRVWTWDYPRKTLSWREDGLPGHDPTHEIAVHFPQRGKSKRPSRMFGRVEVAVDGEKLALLFDTGATVVLSSEALAALGDGRPAERATSFITLRTLERWRKRHPEWRVIERGEQVGKGTYMPIIEVPAVTIAGYTVGPVWFTGRGNASFDDFMSSMMDAHVEGALGGSALSYFRVSLDYPHERALFERP